MDRRDLIKLSALSGVALASCTSSPTTGATGPSVVGSVVTRWDTDPWARGSYSALPPGTPYWVREELGKAVIRGSVVLAGEYTATDFPATVHGAYLSGERAARLLLAQVPDAQQILVVGAGLAGLRAAQVLKQAGRGVVVVEARDRVGGRVHTNTSLGVPAEEGAAWIHGVTRNPMVKVVQQAGLSLVPTDYEDEVAHDYRTGAPVSGVGAAETALWRTLRQIGSTKPPKRASARKAMRTRGWETNTAQRKLVEHSEFDLEYGLPPNRLGAQALWEGKAYRGGDKLVQGGFSAVPERMAQGLDIRLSTPIERVQIAEGVVAGTLRADAAVVAVPLALLQQNQPELPWPGWLRKYLDGLTTGNLEKVFLRYDREWWPKQQVLNVVSAPGLRWSEWYNLADLVSAPVIFGFSGGRSSPTRPGQDPELVEQAASVLQAAYLA